MRRRRELRLAVLVLLALCSAGCVRGCKSSRPPIHINPNMDWQPKYKAQSENEFFYDGRTMRLPVEGTVARGELRDNEEFYTGRDAAGDYLARNPLSVSESTLARGEQRFTIYCQPCHDKRGTGQGILLQYGSVPTATMHDEQRLGYPDGQIFDVITNGSGLMQGYRYPVTAEDRWAIVAWVRKLQQDRVATQVARAEAP